MPPALHLFDPKRAPFRSEVFIRSAGEYSGDYAEAFPLPPSGMVALMSSNSEPGATGAMWMMLTRSVYRLAAMSGNVPSEVLLATHRLLLRDAPGVRESAACIRVDFPEKRILFARAGEVHAILFRAASQFAVPFPGTELVLGEPEVEREIVDRETEGEPGDILVLCGRGTLRARDPSGHALGAGALCKAIERAPRDAKGMAAAIGECIDAHAGGAPLAWDVSVLVVELRGSDESTSRP